MRSAPAIDFGSAAEVQRGGPEGHRDEDEGNVLNLEPRAAEGWQQRPEKEAERQPFGRRHGECRNCLGFQTGAGI